MINIKTFITFLLLFFVFVSLSNVAFSAQSSNSKIETKEYKSKNVKELFNEYDSNVPDYITVRQKIIESSLANPSTSKIHTDTLTDIENLKETVHTPSYVKKTALNFCKQQSLKKTLKDVDKIINGGDFQSYDRIEGMIAEALQVGVSDDVIVDVLDNVSEALEADMRTPISTGIAGLDNLLDGGLSHGELGMVLAPTGTGKTTILTKFANTAVNEGKNVIQFYFEDSTAQIQRKHFTIWSGVQSKHQSEQKEYVEQKINEAIKERVASLGIKIEEGDSKEILLEKERVYSEERRKIEYALESFYRSAHSLCFQLNKKYIPKYLSIIRCIDKRFETGEIYIKWDDSADDDWLILIYIKNNSPDEGIVIEDKTNPENNSTYEFQPNEIFKASDAMVDALTKLLDRERNKRKVS